MIGSRGTGILELHKSDFFRRKSVLPIEQEMLDCDNSEFLSDDEVDEGDVDQYGEEMLKFRKTLFSKANDNIKNAQDRQKRDYDRKHNRQMVSSVKIQIIMAYALQCFLLLGDHVAILY